MDIDRIPSTTPIGKLKIKNFDDIKLPLEKKN
jgi:hypothetical protein